MELAHNRQRLQGETMGQYSERMGIFATDKHNRHSLNEKEFTDIYRGNLWNGLKEWTCDCLKYTEDYFGWQWMVLWFTSGPVVQTFWLNADATNKIEFMHFVYLRYLEAHDALTAQRRNPNTSLTYIGILDARLACWTIVKFQLSHILNETEVRWWIIEKQLNRETWPRRKENIMAMLCASTDLEAQNGNPG